MKPAKSSNRKVRSRSGRSLLGNSPQGRHRASTFKLESLEERLLLSISPSVESTVSSAAVVAGANPASYSSTLPAGLAASVNDAHTVATVVGPSASTPTSLASAAASSHIYTGQPAAFDAPPAGSSATSTSTLSTTNLGQYSPNQQAALTSLMKDLSAVPQYLVYPTGTLNGQPQVGTGPAGYAPAQVAGATVLTMSISATVSSATAPARPSP